MYKKICCIRSLDEAQIVVRAGADAIGFVGIDPPTQRTLADDSIAQIIQEVTHSVSTVLLTASTSAEAIASQLKRTGASDVQLSAEISEEELGKLANSEPGIRRIKVVHVEGQQSLQAINRYSSLVDRFLLDSGNPNVARPVYGGTGRTHDWTVSAEFVRKSPIPVYLAGGLTPENVAKAISQVRPSGVDLCSGVRTADKLDPAKLLAFMSAIQALD